MQEPPVKKILYWCEECNIPLIGRSCACGHQGFPIPLLEPYDVRPALEADRKIIAGLIGEQFGDCPIPKVLLLNKAGGLDRNDLVIANGTRLGWLTFDPVARTFSFDLSPEAVRFMVPGVTRGVLDLETSAELPGDRPAKGRVGGKKFRVRYDGPDGTVIVRYRGKLGTGVINDGWVRVKEVSQVTPATPPDPGWDEVIEKNRYHLKNLERNAVRAIKQFIGKRPVINVSFSGGKDSTAVLMLARKAGITDAFFIDTGIEFPETIDFIRSMGVEIISGAGDFWGAVPKAGPPAKDNRWCCKLLKQNPLRIYLARIGPCITLQGNRWYESWNRAGLELAFTNPLNPLQMNVSPIRNWRALEVFLYLWWQKAPENPLYNRGIERIGCYPCPSMLESEFEGLKTLHPDLAVRWLDVLTTWAEKKGLPAEYVDCGLWRWKHLPRKMQELCREHTIGVTETRDGVVLAADLMRCREDSIRKAPSGNPPPASEIAEKNVPGPTAGDEPQPDGSQDIEGLINGPTGDPTDSMRLLSGPVCDSAGTTRLAGGPEYRPAGNIPGPHIDNEKSDRIRRDFSLLTDFIYLDNASMALSPEPVLEAMLAYERTYRARAASGSHRLAGVAHQRYWHAHQKVEKFIGGSPGGITVFTHHLEEALETVRSGIRWRAGDLVLAGPAEPGPSILPWKRQAHEDQSPVALPIGEDYAPDLERLSELTGRGDIRLFVISHVSDLFGSIAPLEEIVSICHENGTLVLVDGSHSVSHMPVDVGRLGLDFFCFSGHTVLGPTGTGVLWIRDPGTLPAIVHQGEGNSSGLEYSAGSVLDSFESGNPNIAGSIGLGAAIDYLAGVGMDWIGTHDRALTERLITGLSGIEGVRVFTPSEPRRRIANLVFTTKGIEPGDMLRYLEDEADILTGPGTGDIRARMERLGLPGGVVQAGIGLYNNENDIDTLLAAVAGICRGL
jgi:cysteine desulfurase / selenocysteine lyase